LAGCGFGRWPTQGDTIPVTTDRAEPTRVLIEWDDMRGKSDILREEEGEQAEVRKQQLLAQAYDTDAEQGGQPRESDDVYDRLASLGVHVARGARHRPPWVVPECCPSCGAPVDQAEATGEEDPKMHLLPPEVAGAAKRPVLSGGSGPQVRAQSCIG
jgi:hypothetical protein